MPQMSTRRVADVAERVKRQFGDESGVQITNSDILNWVNDAQTEIAVQLGPTKAKSTSVSVPDQAEYSLPPENIVHIESIHYNNVRVPNMQFREAEEKIFASDPNRLSRGVPAFWYEWGPTITFWPTPEEEKNIDVYYTKMPTPLTDLNDLLGVKDKHFDAIISFVMAKAYELDEEFDASNNQMTRFMNRILEQSSEPTQAQQATYSTINFVEDW